MTTPSSLPSPSSSTSASPFSDPDASTPSPPSPRIFKGKGLASSTPFLGNDVRDEGYRLSAMGATTSDLAGLRSRAGSFAAMGGNQGFMQMINALSLEEDVEEEREGEEEVERSEESEVQATPAPDSDSDDEDDDDDAQTTAPEDSDNDDPPSFLSPPASAVSLPVPDVRPLEGKETMSSSIYAIHRPIAARRRTYTGELGEYVKEGAYATASTIREGVIQPVENVVEPDGMVGRKRAGTSATVRSLGRKKKLVGKLMDIFGLKGEEEVVAEFQCWLFRSVLLQGFMYLTTGHICFYAYLPHKEGVVIRSGSISARGQRTRRYHRHWFILKDAALSWYPSSADPYFPDGHIDLHYCTSVEASTKHATHFKVSTADKKWHFAADSEASRDDWVKIVKKVVFRCQNEGESVKISIPLETVIDIERSSNLEFAETIRVRVYDADEGFSIDEYWLSYFVDLAGALDQMTAALDRFRLLHPDEARHAASILDTTHRMPIPSSPIVEETTIPRRTIPLRPQSSLFTRAASSGPTWSSLSSRLRLFPTPTHPTPRISGSVATLTDLPGADTPTRSDSPHPPDHTYPPDPAPGTTPPSTSDRSVPSIWSLPIPTIGSLHSVSGWLKAPRRIVTSLSEPIPSPAPTRRISEVLTSSVMIGEDGEVTGEGGYPPVRDSEEEREGDNEEKMKVAERFRMAFGLTPKEELVAHFSGYLFRGLPLYGKVYISTTFFCFKSAGILAKTKMILPLSDIIAVSKTRSFRIGYVGLIVVIKGHEELFFELSTTQHRDACLHFLEVQTESIQSLLAQGQTPGDTVEHQRHMDLIDLAASHSSSASLDTDHRLDPSSMLGQPPLMFASDSSDFVTFRPEKSLRFTCLTIGSRGDVQPYIALCKGLMAEGHTCKIASHGEYRAWVEGHGIAFEEVGGDPAELMQLMIAHDFFTIAFMKEAIGRFRGWLDELLETTWKACQGSDVLIESPSAIAGYHIAEALRIPYYRAFTMPWSRTRAYPHAFAVPDHKMGGGYNYMTYTMFDQIFWRATSGQVNRWRKKTLGLGSTNLEAMQQHKIPFLYNFSPVVIPPPLDWRENIHVTGYWWLDNPDDSSVQKWQPPPDLLAFLDLAKASSKKVVFIGFGSIIIPDPEEMTRVVSEAVEKAGVFAIIAKGWSDRATSKDDSDEQRREGIEQERKEAELMKRHYIFNIKSIPHDWLFPRIHAAVHHGGSGTTGASLRAGLPTIIKPFFGDQHFYADRVATLGIGSAVRVMTVDNLATAITTAVTDEKQISRARLAGEAIRKEDGVGNAIQCIYRDLDYAKSLIPPPPSAPAQKLSRSHSTRTPLPTTSPALSPRMRTSTSQSRRDESKGSSDGDALDSWDVLSRGSGATWDGEDSFSRGSSIKSPSPARSVGLAGSDSEGEDPRVGRRSKSVGRL